MYKLNLSQNFDLRTLTICFLPLSIIFGNLILNINILFLIFLFIIDNLNKKNYKSIFVSNKKFILLLVLFLMFNLINSANWQITFRGQLGLIKHILLYFALIYYFFKNEKNFKLLIDVFVLAIIFVLIDSYIQFFFGKDLFGYEVTDNHGRRLSGPFGDEYIVGSFILKTIFVTRYNQYLENKINWILYLLISFFLVILASQRMPTIMFSSALILIFFIDNKLKLRFKFLIIFTCLISFLAILNLNPKVKEHYIDRSFEQIGIGNVSKKKFWDSQWGAHYLTAIEIYKDNIIFGSGLKTFRFECSNQDYSKVDSLLVDKRCSTHPHNIYLEILSETGTFGLLLFLFFLINFFKTNKIFSKKLMNTNPEILILVFIFFWPIQSTGAIFSTWNGFFYPLILSYIYYISQVKTKSRENQNL